MDNRMELELTDRDGNTEAVSVPAKMVVCSRCEGHGAILTPSIGQHAYTEEEFEDAFPRGSEEREAYFTRGGVFDVECPICKGRNVVQVPDLARATAEERGAIGLWDAQRRRAEAEARRDLATYRGEMGMVD